MTVVDAVRDLYVSRWGHPTREAQFTVGEYKMRVLKWAEADNGEGVDLYATLGSSARPIPGIDEGHRVEFHLGLKPGQDAVASPLAALGLYSSREGVALDHGHTVPAAQPLWPGAPMPYLLVARPDPPILEPLELTDGTHVEFLQAVPLFESEREFKAANGIEALIARWHESQTPFWDPGREDMFVDSAA